MTLFGARLRLAATALVFVAATGLAERPKAQEPGEKASACAVISVAQAIAGADRSGAEAESCVTIQAWLVGDVLMDRPEDRYSLPRLYNDPSSSGVQLGLTGWVDAENSGDALGQGRKPRAASAAHLRLTGRLRRCDPPASGNLLPDPAGADFCQRNAGLYLAADAAELLNRAPLVRAVAAARGAKGNLVPLDQGRVRDSMLAAFQAVLAPHRGDGGQVMRRIMGLPSDAAWAGQSALASDASIEILGWREPAWADAAARAGWAEQQRGAAEAVACAMDPGRASRNLWPISTRDIGIAINRPYLCARLKQSADGRIAIEWPVDAQPAEEG